MDGSTWFFAVKRFKLAVTVPHAVYIVRARRWDPGPYGRREIGVVSKKRFRFIGTKTLQNSRRG